MSKYDYKKHNISSLNDVYALEDIIKTHRGFKAKDFKRCLLQASLSEQRSRITLRLNRLIKPLIDPKHSNTQINTGDNSTEKDSLKQNQGCKSQGQIGVKTTQEWITQAYSKTHKASKFLFKEGRIELGCLYLKSVRIHPVDQSLLKNIQHRFRIAPDYSGTNRFHFVPYDDLSLFINQIEQQATIIKRQKRIQDNKLKRQQNILKYENFKPSIITEIDNYLISQLSNPYSREYLDIRKIQSIFDILKETKLLDNKFAFQSFYQQFEQCNLYVPLSYVTISDGEITIKIDDYVYPNSFNWDIFISWLSFKTKIKFYKSWKKDIKAIYDNRLSLMKHHYCPMEYIKIKTHMSKQSFEETITRHLDFGIDCCSILEPQNLPSDDFDGTIKYSFCIPSTFLKNEYNDGVSLFYNINRHLLKLVLTSEQYEFPSAIKDAFFECLHTYQPLEFDFYYEAIMHSYEPSARIIPPKYVERQKIINFNYFGITNPLILQFYEDCAHLSDNYIGLVRGANGHKSYIIIDELTGRIFLAPTDTKYAIYLFQTDKRSSIMVAVYLIIMYFQSNYHNKRQGFALSKLFKHFGIHSFKRL